MITRFFALAACTALLSQTSVVAQDATTPPRDNPYDVIGKVFAPFWSVLLDGSRSPNKACTMTIVLTQVTGRLPKQMEGATLKAAVQFPDKVRLTAPVLGEEITVCRNGNEVWAVPGQKVEYLLNQFKVKPGKTKKANTPLFLPFTAQQAIFLPALFSMVRPEVAEVDTFNGEECRLITAELMPDLARAVKAEGFRAQIWVAPGYFPRKITITQPDFTAVVEIRDLKFGASLQPATWEVPAGITDVYRTNADMLDSVLFVVMNSLKMNEGDKPWLDAK